MVWEYLTEKVESGGLLGGKMHVETREILLILKRVKAAATDT